MDYFFFPDLATVTSEVCGCAMLNPGWKHMRRLLEQDSVLILGRKNTALVDDAGTELEIRPGRLVLLPAGRLHRGKARIAAPVSYYWVHFRPRRPIEVWDDSLTQEVLRAHRGSRDKLAEGALLPHWLDLEDVEPVALAFQELLAEHQHHGYSPWRYQVLVQLLLMRVTESLVAQKAGRKTPPLVDAILVALESRLSDPGLSVKSMGADLDLTPDYIGRRFRADFGLSVGQYIVNRRVELAKLRLQETTVPLAQVATQCGFGSLRQFHHHFKAVTSFTPGDYRRRRGAMTVNGL